MKTRSHATRSIALAACCALAACAGSAAAPPPAASPAGYAQPAAPPPSTPAKAMEPSSMPNAPAPAGSMAAPAAESAPASAPTPTQPTAQGAADSSRDQPGARSASKAGMGDLERAEREIASGDCGTACRALGSMERAVAFLCMQTQSDGDTNRCSDAKSRLVTSRKRVRAACGSCAGGPSVDPDAPVPSTR
jgi:hypothetical protein